MVVVTDTTTAVMCRQCQAAVAVIKTSKSRIKEFFRRFVKKGVFADLRRYDRSAGLYPHILQWQSRFASIEKTKQLQGLDRTTF